jgi:hypothetical protein
MSVHRRELPRAEPMPTPYDLGNSKWTHRCTVPILVQDEYIDKQLFSYGSRWETRLDFSDVVSYFSREAAQRAIDNGEYPPLPCA